MRYDTDEYYPTPDKLIAEMLGGTDLDSIRTVLEPSAGKGSIVKHILARDRYNHRDYDIDAIELSRELRHVLKGEGIRVVHDDFMTFQSLKRYDLVIMNPPFSNGDKHVLKALSFVREGGRLVAILNAETVRNPYTNTRKELAATLSALGAHIAYKQNAFISAENPSGVEIAVISVDMPEQERESVLLNHFRRAEEHAPPKDYNSDNPLVSNDKIKAMVERYEHEARKGVLLIDEYLQIAKHMIVDQHDRKPLLQMVVEDDTSRIYDNPHKSINLFLHNLRLRFWRALFDAREFSDRLTSNVQSDLHSRVSEFAHYEFSLFNIYELYIELGQSIVSNIKDTIVKLFDDFTARYHWADYSSNVLHYNGWKTNDAFKINYKVIIPLYGSWNRWYGDGRFELGYDVARKLRDIEKTFDYLAGSLDNDHESLATIIAEASRTGQRRNVRFKHFSASFFKKGTCHLVFHDANLVKKFNIFAGQQKKWLPPGYGQDDYVSMDAESQRVIDDFEGSESYAHTMKNRSYFLPTDAGL